MSLAIEEYMNPKTFENIRSFSEDKETPFLVIDTATIAQAYDDLRAGFEFAKVYYAVKANPAVEIIELLKIVPMSVNSIAESLGVTQSAVSQHLRILKAAGLVSDERHGYWIYYSLNREVLEKCRQRLNRVCTCGCGGNGEKKCT